MIIVGIATFDAATLGLAIEEFRVALVVAIAMTDGTDEGTKLVVTVVVLEATGRVVKDVTLLALLADVVEVMAARTVALIDDVIEGMAARTVAFDAVCRAIGAEVEEIVDDMITDISDATVVVLTGDGIANGRVAVADVALVMLVVALTGDGTAIGRVEMAEVALAMLVVLMDVGIASGSVDTAVVILAEGALVVLINVGIISGSVDTAVVTLATLI